MGSKTISLSDDAYERLSAMKKPGESFSDVIRRLTRRTSLLELEGILSDAEADALDEAIQANRRDRLQARRKELGLG